MTKILNFTGSTLNEITPSTMIENIDFDKYTHVVVLALDGEDMFYAHSSTPDTPLILYMLEKLKMGLFKIGDK